MIVPPRPPWLDDEEPDAWVCLREAEKRFRKSRSTMRVLAESRALPSYFDGYRWWVRLEPNNTRNSD